MCVHFDFYSFEFLLRNLFKVSNMDHAIDCWIYRNTVVS